MMPKTIHRMHPEDAQLRQSARDASHRVYMPLHHPCDKHGHAPRNVHNNACALCAYERYRERRGSKETRSSSITYARTIQSICAPVFVSPDPSTAFAAIRKSPRFAAAMAYEPRYFSSNACSVCGMTGARDTVTDACLSCNTVAQLPPVEGSPVEGSPVEGSPVEGSPVEGSPVVSTTVTVPAQNDAALFMSKQQRKDFQSFLRGGTVRNRRAKVERTNEDYAVNVDIRNAAKNMGLTYYVPFDGYGCYHEDADQFGTLRVHGRTAHFTKSGKCVICERRRMWTKRMSYGTLNVHEVNARNASLRAEVDDMVHKWNEMITGDPFMAPSSAQQVISRLALGPNSIPANMLSASAKTCDERRIAKENNATTFLFNCATHGLTEFYTANARCVKCTIVSNHKRYERARFGGLPYRKRDTFWLVSPSIHPLLNTGRAPNRLPSHFIKMLRTMGDNFFRDVGDMRGAFLRPYVYGPNNTYVDMHMRPDLDAQYVFDTPLDVYDCTDNVPFHGHLHTTDGECAACHTIMRTGAGNCQPAALAHPPFSEEAAYKIGSPVFYNEKVNDNSPEGYAPVAGIPMNARIARYIYNMHGSEETRPLLSLRYSEAHEPAYDEMSWPGYHPYNNPACRYNGEQLFIETEACLMSQHMPLAYLHAERYVLINDGYETVLADTRQEGFTFGKDYVGPRMIYSAVCVGCGDNASYEAILDRYAKLVKFGNFLKSRYYARSTDAVVEHYVDQFRRLDLLLTRHGMPSLMNNSTSTTPYLDLYDAIRNMSTDERINFAHFLNMLRKVFGKRLTKHVFLPYADVIRQAPYLAAHMPGRPLGEEVPINHPAPLINGKLELSAIDALMFLEARRLFDQPDMHAIFDRFAVSQLRWTVERDIKLGPDDIMYEMAYKAKQKAKELDSYIPSVKATTLLGVMINSKAHDALGRITKNGEILGGDALVYHINSVVSTFLMGCGISGVDTEALVALIRNAHEDQ